VRAWLRWWHRRRDPAVASARRAIEGVQTLTVRGRVLRVAVIVGRDITGISAFT